MVWHTAAMWELSGVVMGHGAVMCWDGGDLGRWVHIVSWWVYLSTWELGEGTMFIYGDTSTSIGTLYCVLILLLAASLFNL